MSDLPQRSRLYQNHHFDSTRWDWFETRPDDIVVGTSYKAGTTWTQAILANLLFPDGSFPDDPGRPTALQLAVEPLEVRERATFECRSSPAPAFEVVRDAPQLLIVVDRSMLPESMLHELR